MQPLHYHVILNVNSGTAIAHGITPETLERSFAAQGHEATIDADCDSPLAERIARAKASGADVIVAAGGDGTATAIASAVLGTEQAMAILPLGTANLLARDLGLPLDLEQAVTALAQMEPRRIDVGEVNGRAFLHKVVIGLAPAIAAGREQIRGRTDLGAKIAFARYFFRRLARTRRIAVEITPNKGDPRIERVQSLAVANNGYDEGFGRIFSRERLDRGSLSLYVLKHLNLRDLFRLVVGMVLGHWQQDEALQIQNVRAVTIRTKRKMLKAMIDGEVETLQTPLSFRIRPGALIVLAPAPPAEAVPEPILPEPALATGS